LEFLGRGQVEVGASDEVANTTAGWGPLDGRSPVVVHTDIWAPMDALASSLTHASIEPPDPFGLALAHDSGQDFHLSCMLVCLVEAKAVLLGIWNLESVKDVS